MGSSLHHVGQGFRNTQMGQAVLNGKFRDTLNYIAAALLARVFQTLAQAVEAIQDM